MEVIAEIGGMGIGGIVVGVLIAVIVWMWFA